MLTRTRCGHITLYNTHGPKIPKNVLLKMKWCLSSTDGSVIQNHPGTPFFLTFEMYIEVLITLVILSGFLQHVL